MTRKIIKDDAYPRCRVDGKPPIRTDTKDCWNIELVIQARDNTVFKVFDLSIFQVPLLLLHKQDPSEVDEFIEVIGKSFNRLERDNRNILF